MEGYRNRSVMLEQGPERDDSRDAPSAEPGLAIIEPSVSQAGIVPEWDARRSVFEKLALLQASKRTRFSDDPLVRGGRRNRSV